MIRRYTPVDFDPSTGLDDVPAALPTGAAWLVAVTIPPSYITAANKHRAVSECLRIDSNTNFHHCAGLLMIRDNL